MWLIYFESVILAFEIHCAAVHKNFRFISDNFERMKIRKTRRTKQMECYLFKIYKQFDLQNSSFNKVLVWYRKWSSHSDYYASNKKTPKSSLFLTLQNWSKQEKAVSKVQHQLLHKKNLYKIVVKYCFICIYNVISLEYFIQAASHYSPKYISIHEHHI